MRRTVVLRVVPTFALLIVASLVLWAVGAFTVSAQQPTKRVAILSMASPTSGSYESTAAGESGTNATVIDEAGWRSMTTADFAAFDALVVPERSCTAAFEVLEQTAGAWAPAVEGNELLIGTDPSDHAGQGGSDLVRDGIAFAADADATGLYMAFECDRLDANMVALLDKVDGSTGQFATRTADCYNRAHRAADHPAFANTTDATLSNWSCSVHNAFERWPDRYRVLAIAEELGTFTAPDGSIGLPYVLAAGQSVTYAGRDLVAMGDSVSAGEGIGYGYEWNAASKRWEDKNGANAYWMVDFQPLGCHQSEEAHPRVLAALTGAALKEHLSCTGATFDKGIAGVQDTSGVTAPQLGGFTPGPAYNQKYLDANPDIVTLSLGANDIEFSSVVAGCFYPVFQPIVGGCPDTIKRANERINDDNYIAERYRDTYEQIHNTGSHAGKRPLVIHTEYVDPFPSASQEQDCFDIQGGWTSGFSRDEINDMQDGLKKLNGLIRSQAAAKNGVISVPVSSAFQQHTFCSDDPWVFGMDTAVDWRSTLTATDIKTSAPFHPTAAGQAEIARQIKRTMDSAVAMRRGGSDVNVRYATGESLTFEEVTQPGTTLIVQTADGLLPDHGNFRVRTGYQIETAASYTGSIAVSLPAQAGDSLWHYTGGSWQQVQSTYNGTQLQGSVSSLSPFAVGPVVPPVGAQITGGDGGVAPEEVAFSASDSTGPVDTVSWDFGDGTTGDGMSVAHRYRYSGTYEVTVTVTSTDGAVDRSTKVVAITNPAPELIAEVPATVTVGEDVLLDSARSTDANGQVDRGWWEVDGKVSEPVGQRNTIRFDTPGAVEVVGVVADDELKETRRTFRIDVRPRPSSTPPDPGPRDPGPAQPTPPPPPAGFSFADASAAELLAACAGRPVIVNAVATSGGRLTVRGAAPTLVGRTVRVRRAGSRRVLGTTSVKADGMFAVRLSRSARATGRYVATIGRVSSAPTGVVRAASVAHIARLRGGPATGSVRIRGTVAGPVRRGQITVERLVACGRYERVGTTTTRRAGGFVVNVPAPAARAAVYRLRIRITPRGRARARTVVTAPVAVALR